MSIKLFFEVLISLKNTKKDTRGHFLLTAFLLRNYMNTNKTLAITAVFVELNELNDKELLNLIDFIVSLQEQNICFLVFEQTFVHFIFKKSMFQLNVLNAA